MSSAPAPQSRNLVLAAMIFAVAMTFIDTTIVAIAAPEIQKELSLSSTGLQWVINGYLVALAALFAFGGRLSDMFGHRKLLVIGIVVFTSASIMNGLTPTGDAAEVWIVTFRIVQGAGAALLFPAALAIVVATFTLRERGRALGIFFGFAGGLTALGPFAGGYLDAWTWRAIFWVNVPVAIIALVLIAKAKIVDEPQRAPIDWLGAALVAGGMALSVVGLQQASAWGWTSAGTLGLLTAGLVVLVAFVLHELRSRTPLIRMGIFASRAFSAECAVIFLSSAVFVPVFFFASMYAQVALGWSPENAGLYLLIFFAGYAPAVQLGGRMLDKRGARPAVVVGSAIAAFGFAFWGMRADQLSESAQWVAIVIAGAGTGLMFSPANTDAVSRAPSTSYGEATGITQTIRYYGASIGMAVMGAILLTVNRSNLEASLATFGVSKSRADSIAESLTGSGGNDQASFAKQAGSKATEIFDAVRLDFAQATRVILFVMAGIMAVTALVALVALPKGRQELDDEPDPAPAATARRSAAASPVVQRRSSRSTRR